MKYKTWHIILAVSLCVAIVLLVWHSCQRPNPPEHVDDIRMSVVPVDKEDGVTYLRIHYGYCVNGEWKDFPAEYYDIKSIFLEETFTGYEAVSIDHIVAIGQYVLVSLCDFYTLQETENGYIEITDSSGNQILQKFKEYYYDAADSFTDKKYGTVARSSELLQGMFAKEFRANVFGNYYYIILERDSIPESYTLQRITHTKEQIFTDTLSYDQIMNLICD